LLDSLFKALYNFFPKNLFLEGYLRLGQARPPKAGDLEDLPRSKKLWI
jgi:hypothetical protein